MSKAQVEKDITELYGERNKKTQIEEYYKNKRKEMTLIIIVIFLVVIGSFVLESKETKVNNNGLLRNPQGKGKKEYQLELKIGEEGWEPFSIELEDKNYTNRELEELFNEAKHILEEKILNGNENLGKVTDNLALITQMEGYPFLITWYSTCPEKIDDDGVLFYENITKEENVELKVQFLYEEWKREEILQITLIPKNTEDHLHHLKKLLSKQQSENREEEVFYLPESYLEKELYWRYPKSNSTFVIIILFLLILPFISYQKDRVIHRKVQLRRERLLSDFPEFVSRLILYMEAGMNIQGAIYRIQKNYRKNGRKNKDLYDEISYVCRQIDNGLSPKDGYELLAKRCNLPCYRKLTGLMIQHMQKGSNTILENLRKEAKKANEEQKARIQKKGEEMETKLLFPMIIMLGIVMIFIMVPALFSFQI